MSTSLSTPLRYATLQHSWPAFEAEILKLLADLHLTALNLECDHVALRVNSIESADAIRHDLSTLGRVISENQINGRSIVIIALNTPLQLGGFSIDCIELPYPSDKVYPQEGWEHIELVLPSTARDCAMLATLLSAQCPSLAPLLDATDYDDTALSIAPELRQVQIKMSSPKGDKERLPNPTIAFKRGNVCIKLHPHGIKTVIASEVD